MKYSKNISVCLYRNKGTNHLQVLGIWEKENQVKSYVDGLHNTVELSSL